MVRAGDPAMRVAITEGHLSLRPHNKCEILREWIAGLYHGKVLNLYERNGDFVDVATLADFEGTTWLVNAMMLGSPRERPYLLPVGHVMRLYRRHGGDRGVAVTANDSGLDVAAGRRGDMLYLHVVNPDLDSAVVTDLIVEAGTVAGITGYEIAPGHHSDAIDTTNPDVFDVRERRAEPTGGPLRWIFPRASVTALAIELGQTP